MHNKYAVIFITTNGYNLRIIENKSIEQIVEEEHKYVEMNGLKDKDYLHILKISPETGETEPIYDIRYGYIDQLNI